MEYSTEQEIFWAGNFGNDYSRRNAGEKLISSNTALFYNVLRKTSGIKTVLEFGANIGLNISAIQRILPGTEFSAIEINQIAVEELRKRSEGKVHVYHMSILDYIVDYKRDFVFTKGFLIHINPDLLPKVYQLLYDSSNRYICIAEYYNPSPVMISYRGNENKLFKRDYAGELLEKYKELTLIDYGFAYHRDNNFPQDDLTWFLFEKQVNNKEIII